MARRYIWYLNSIRPVKESFEINLPRDRNDTDSNHYGSEYLASFDSINDFGMDVRSVRLINQILPARVIPSEGSRHRYF